MLHADDSPAPEGVYELRVYTCAPGRLDALHRRFRDHTLKLFARHGMTNVAYFTPAEGPAADNTLVYFLWHKSQEAAAESFQNFRNDPQWQRVRAESERDAPILSQPVDSTFLKLTNYSRPLPAARADRIYELRVYTAAEGKLEALQQRFRDHTLRLFEKHGMENVAYFVPTDAPKSSDTLVYLLAHKDREAARRSWNAFADDPEWQQARAASESNGALVASVEATFLLPTDYTPAGTP